MQDNYVQVQKDSFLLINTSLGQYLSLHHNLTQMGDTLIFLSFLSILIVYAPKVWEALIVALVFSLLLTSIPKKIFAIPRPAAMFDNAQMIIIGERLSGHNSFPSGHSITIFSILTVLLFSYLPNNMGYKLLWFLAFIFIGGFLCATRVGVGAHYPLDVLVGSIIGYISGLLGIFISRKYPLCGWVCNKKFYPLFILFFIGCSLVLINKIINENLFIFYLAFISLVVSLYKITHVYIKK